MSLPKSLLHPVVPTIKINRIKSNLKSDPKMVVARFFYNGVERSQDLIKRLLQFNREEIKEQMSMIKKKYQRRHRNFISVLEEHYKNIEHLVTKECKTNNMRLPTAKHKQLIGAYFTHEYSISAGALFNPSIVPIRTEKSNSNHVDFVLSLRATGEGHISSIVFRTGRYYLDEDKIILDDPQYPIKTPSLQRCFAFDKNSFEQRLTGMGINNQFCKVFMSYITDEHFSYQNFQIAVHRFEQNYGMIDERDERFWLNKIKWLADSYLELQFNETDIITERVIFPIAEHEKNGIEDARFVQFQDGDESVYYGTYTAFDGRLILPKLIKTTDFKNFEIRPLQGYKTIQKNFALFPRKIKGKYAMLSRLDGINHYYMVSDNVYQWDDAQMIHLKKSPWESIQTGNCGSPIETSDGWLVITHGVGAMREYSLGAILLDLDNPLRVIASLSTPLMTPLRSERDGYVPNVLYSCGSMVFKDRLILSYAHSDTRIGFATMSVQELLDVLKHPSNLQ